MKAIVWFDNVEWASEIVQGKHMTVITKKNGVTVLRIHDKEWNVVRVIHYAKVYRIDIKVK